MKLGINSNEHLHLVFVRVLTILSINLRVHHIIEH